MSLHDLSLPSVIDHPTNHTSDYTQLSSFQQTLREKDEEFYKTFPAARIALEQQSHTYVWRPVHQTSGCLPGPGFQLDYIAFQGALDYPFDPAPTQPLSHMSSQSPSSVSFNPAHLPSPPAGFYDTPTQNHHYTGYAIPQLGPTDAQGEQIISVSAPLTLNSRTPAFNVPYPIQPHQYHHHHHQRVPSPVMDSLPSPDSTSDPSQASHNSPHYHTPPHQTYYTTLPLNANALPSPAHQDIPAPLSPPALVQATYPGKHEPEQHSVFTEPLPSPQRDSSVPPPRRNSQHILHRSQRRYSPPYSRPLHSTHKSTGSGNAIPTPVSTMGWPLPSSAPTTPSGITVSANAGTSLVDAVNTAAAQAAATATATATATAAAAATTTATAVTIVPPPMPGPSSNTSTILKPRPSVTSLSQSPVPRTGNATTTAMISNKRHSDKKPALACVFCRGRKIACGPPLNDGDGKTCNQCHRRSLRCEYPTESRRGMRKKPSTSTNTTNPTTTSPSTGVAIVSDNNHAPGNPKPNTNPESPKVSSNKKR